MRERETLNLTALQLWHLSISDDLTLLIIFFDAEFAILVSEIDITSCTYFTFPRFPGGVIRPMTCTHKSTAEFGSPT